MAVAARLPGGPYTSLQIRMTADTTGLERALEALGDEAIRAEVRALNRTITTVQTAAVRALADDLGIQQKRVREGLSVQRATFRDPEASLTVSGRRLPLYAFGGAKAAQGIAGAFVRTLRSGHVGIFKRRLPGQRWTAGRPRTSTPNLPIIELRGASLPYVAAKEKITDLLVSTADDTLRRNLEHEVAFLSQQAASR